MLSRYRWTTASKHQVTGRNYKEMRDVHCFECEKNLRELTPQGKFLKWCEYVECRVFLCPDCRTNHEGMHQLAGDEHQSEKLNQQIRHINKMLEEMRK